MVRADHRRKVVLSKGGTKPDVEKITAADTETRAGASYVSEFFADDELTVAAHCPPDHLVLVGGQLPRRVQRVAAQNEPHPVPLDPTESFLTVLDMMLRKRCSQSNHDGIDHPRLNGEGVAPRQGPGTAAEAGSGSTEMQSPGSTGSHDSFGEPVHSDEFLWDYEEMAPGLCRSADRPWDCRGLIRAQIRHYLDSVIVNGEVGDFIVRDRRAEVGTLALQVKTALAAYSTMVIDIHATANGMQSFKLRDTTAPSFPTLTELVQYYAAEARHEIDFVQLRMPGGEGLGLPSDSQTRVSMLRPTGAEAAAFLSRIQTAALAEAAYRRRRCRRPSA